MALWRRWPIGRIPRFTVTCGPGFIRGMGAQAKPPPSIPKILANHRFRRVASPTINSRIESQENGGHRGFPFYEMPPVFIVWFGIRYGWAMPTLPSSMKVWSWGKDHPLIDYVGDEGGTVCALLLPPQHRFRGMYHGTVLSSVMPSTNSAASCPGAPGADFFRILTPRVARPRSSPGVVTRYTAPASWVSISPRGDVLA
jgi:hypothetical protein